MSDEQQNTSLIALARDELTRAQDVIATLTNALQSAAPKVEFYDVVTQSGDTKDFAEVAKILNVPGLGRNNLMALLRDMRVLRQNNEPYQQYVDRGYFKLVEVDKTDSTGHTRVFSKTVVTQKGIHWIQQQLRELNDEA